MKELIQQDYNKIIDFRTNWLEKLALKYNLTEVQVLELIDL